MLMACIHVCECEGVRVCVRVFVYIFFNKEINFQFIELQVIYLNSFVDVNNTRDDIFLNSFFFLKGNLWLYG